ncbi:MAG: hypothetical protein A2X12_11445, partial [Bacteroidetes bacterium GWE2_29_8]
MQVNKFGLTWWGKEWLNSLSNIDYDNRLPRGRSYANKGAVKSIEIKENTIIAKVKGSRVTPYKVIVMIPMFNEKQKKDLSEAIQQNQHLLAKLLNKELSPDIKDLALSKGIKLFPTSWRDFEMNCNCPDWAVPCKHLAAVVYLIANEIDKNPFLLLTLRGFDIETLIGTKGATLNLDIPKYENLFIDVNKDIFTKKDIKALDDIDLSLIKKKETLPIELLAEAPVFTNIDFKLILEKIYSGIARYLEKVYKESSFIEYGIDYNTNLSLYFDNEGGFIYSNINKSNNISYTETEKIMAWLYYIEPFKLPICSYNLVYLYKVYLFCLRLLTTGNFIPQLWNTKENRYFIRWIPSYLNEDFKEVIDKLIEAMPLDLVVFVKEEKKKKSVEKSAESKELFTHLCHYLMINLIYSGRMETKLSNILHSTSANNFKDLTELFFSPKAVSFDKFSTKEIPISVNQWLRVFEISDRHYLPVIKVDEINNGFEISMMIQDKKEQMSLPIKLSAIFTSKNNKYNKIDILQDIGVISHYFPLIDKLIANEGKKTEKVTITEFSDILLKILPVVKMLGVRLIMPKSLKSLVYPKASLQLKKSTKEKGKSILALTELINYDWQIAVGKNIVSKDEFLSLVKGLTGLVKFKDSYIMLDEAQMKLLYKNLEEEKQLNSFDLLQIGLSEEYKGARVGISKEVNDIINQIRSTIKLPLPKGITANLRPYQIRGYEWLVKNIQIGLGSIIADDMGLGKTLQVITVIQYFKEQKMINDKPVLVVAPTTLITNWCNEFAKFAPKLKIAVYHGVKRIFDFKNTDIVITSYGLIRNDIEEFAKIKWHTIIIDEAQNIKNNNTEQAKSVKKIRAEHRIAMSGTPVENKLSEYWSIFDFTNKGYLGSANSFNEEFANPISLNRDKAKIEMFRKITAPFIIRRVKTDKTIIADLPDKITNNQYSNLTQQQAALYKSVVDETIKQIENSEGIERKGLVLKLMIALKQIGNHPLQYLKKGKIDAELSGKCALLLELITNILDCNEKMLIFTQYKEMGNILTELIQKHIGINPLFLHGSISRKQRDDMVEKFQNNNNERIFILSIKAGGTGLNLTSASNVIHFDLWWNPAVEN